MPTRIASALTPLWPWEPSCSGCRPIGSAWAPYKHIFCLAPASTWWSLTWIYMWSIHVCPCLRLFFMLSFPLWSSLELTDQYYYEFLANHLCFVMFNVFAISLEHLLSKCFDFNMSYFVGPKSMTEYCTGILNDGKYLFSCPDPGCNAEWQYFLVRHVACLTPSQMQEFEKWIFENFMKREEEGVQKCPGCGVPCTRMDKTDNCVRCHFCTEKHGYQFLFCCKCLGTWNIGFGNTCGNTPCPRIDNRVTILESCPNKLILEKFEAPSMRGCPKCGMLI